CQLNENVRGTDTFLIQPTGPPVNQNLMELLIMIDAVKRASAARITAVLPYYGYARQDRKDKPRVPISAKLVADLLTAAGADRILACCSHAVLSGPAVSRLAESAIERLVTTNTIPIEPAKLTTARIHSLSIAPLLGEAIARIHNNSSVSSLFV